MPVLVACPSACWLACVDPYPEYPPAAVAHCFPGHEAAECATRGLWARRNYLESCLPLASPLDESAIRQEIGDITHVLTAWNLLYSAQHSTCEETRRRCLMMLERHVGPENFCRGIMPVLPLR